MKKKLMLMLTFFFIGISVALAQTQKVTGQVISEEDGEPIIGASVYVKGNTTIGTITDVDGNFTLTGIPASAKFLVISYVGFTAQEVAIKPIIKVSMKSDAQIIDNVVVIAFGTAKKSSLSGSVAQVGSKEISQRQVSNVTQALVGKTPGITVSSSNNQPGTTAAVSIRGIGSFSAKTTPLYVVDGVPYDGDISAINTQDIESMSVLKDAASAALYGARGANGVIMITTKSGDRNASRMNVTVDARYGFNQRGIPNYETITDPKVYAAKYFESMYNYARGKKDATDESAFAEANKMFFATDGKTSNLAYPIFTIPTGVEPFVRQSNGSFRMADGVTVGALYENDGKSYWLQPDDWAKEVFSNNPRQEYNLSVSGSNDKANYYMSAGYLNDKGYVVGSGFERFTTRLRVDFRPLKWLNLGANIGYTHYKNTALNNDELTNSGSSANIFAITDQIAPYYPIYVRDKDGNIMKDSFGNTVYDFGTKEYSGLTRPFMSISNPKAKYELDVRHLIADIVAAKGYVDFNIIDGLKVTLNAGYDVDNTYFTNKSNPFYGQYANRGNIHKEFERFQAINLQQLATYNTSFGDHNFNILLGHEYYKRTTENLWGSKEMMYDPYNEELSGAILKPNTSSSIARYATEGYLGRVMYDYKNRYFFSASYRRDASSRFHKDHRWGNFWSVGGAWLVHQEDFFRPLTGTINNLKVKLSYGVQGNDNLNSSFYYMDLFSLRNANDLLSIAFAQKGNKNLTWETSKNLNFGFEIGLFKDRLTAEVDLYTREVTDMLFFRTVSRTAGYGGYYDNLGSMRNTGIDFTISGVLLKKKDLEWTASINGGYFKNKLTKLPAEWNAVEGGYRDGNAIYREGGSIYDRTIPVYLGVNEEGQALYQAHKKDANNKYTDELYATTDYPEANKAENRIIITNRRPMWQGGFSTAVNFKGFDLSMGFSYALGGKTYDSMYAAHMHGGNSDNFGRTWHKDILNSWTPANTNTDIPKLNLGGKYFNSYSTRFLISRSYLALNNITFGYTFDAKTLAPIGINTARVYVAADNVALWSARKGFDPRFGEAIGYKAIRTISLGVKLGF
ncbi:MAG: TonB-dependent receptor [Phocaeicola sp.]|nr:TonB-dependent receptor [Phocaeicola sp.]